MSWLCYLPRHAARSCMSGTSADCWKVEVAPLRNPLCLTTHHEKKRTVLLTLRLPDDAPGIPHEPFCFVGTSMASWPMRGCLCRW